MPRKSKSEVKLDAVPTPMNASTSVSGEQSPTEYPKYVVVRAGFRVSESEYNDPNDPSAIDECNFWSRVSKDSKDGSKVEIVPFNKKLHRIY